MGYSLIYADPPWEYGNTISNGAAENHYGTMKLIDIKRLPVWELASEDSVLAMWFTGTHTREAIELAEAWGFKVRTMKGFTWVKFNSLAEQHINKAFQAGGVPTLNKYEDPLEFLKSVMNDPNLEIDDRKDAAKAMLPYIHQKKGEGGKKDAKGAAAKNAANKFAVPAPPKLVVNNRG